MRTPLDLARPLLPAGVKRRLLRALPTRLAHLTGPGSDRGAVALLWAPVGKLQLDLLVSEGLRPEHWFLEVGCGSLRDGVHVIRYLDPGRYYGIDGDADRLEEGRTDELPRHELLEKRPVLELIDDFGFERLARTFDYALAGSLFSSLPPGEVEPFLAGIARVLAPGGRFYAPVPPGAHAGAGTGLAAETIADWGDPHGRHMLRFTKT